MHIKTVCLLLTVFCLMLYSFPLVSKLSDFKSDVEKEEDENRKSWSSGGSSYSSSDEETAETDVNADDIGACIDGCILLFQVIGYWAEVQKPVSFLEYPYIKNNQSVRFIYREDIVRKSESAEPDYYGERKLQAPYKPPTPQTVNPGTELLVEKEIIIDNMPKTVYIKPKTKHYFHTVDSGYLYAFGDGMGFFVDYDGKFTQYFGANIEFRKIIDGSDRLNYTAFGITFPLSQYDPAIWNIYGQIINMSGILNRSGYCIGSSIDIYPKKPFLLSFKVGYQKYPDINFMDLEAKCGFIYKRVELFIGGRNIFSQDNASIKTVSFGAKVHF